MTSPLHPTFIISDASHFPQLGATLIYITAYGMDGVIAMSLAVGTFSLFLSIMNMILDFPKQLFDIAQREGEAHVFALQAEVRMHIHAHVHVHVPMHPLIRMQSPLRMRACSHNLHALGALTSPCVACYVLCVMCYVCTGEERVLGEEDGS